MSKTKGVVNVICSLLLVPIVQSEESLGDAISNGATQLDLRMRYEQVDQNAPINLDADALTLRTRLNYLTSSYQGFKSFVEFDDVSTLGIDDYNSTTNGQGDKAKIVDPVGTEVNQAWVSYKNGETYFKWGRQRIILDNQRFIGGVGFRQNEQTYDGFSITNSSFENTNIFYANVHSVNRIFGKEGVGGAKGDHKSDTDLLNIKYEGLPLSTLVGYAYLIDNQDNSRFSTDTYGIRYQGKLRDLNYILEYASQRESGKNSLKYKADYILAEMSYQVDDVALTFGYEVLGSDSGDAAFITPLATGHKFQGWSDQFLVTPGEGIADVYFSADTNFDDIKLLASYHHFKADQNNIIGHDDLGHEINLSATKKIGIFTVNAKYASYSAGDVSFGKSDTDKLWLTVSTVFK